MKHDRMKSIQTVFRKDDDVHVSLSRNGTIQMTVNKDITEEVII